METSKIQHLAKCSRNTAININYYLGLDCQGLLYLNKGCYALSTIEWFKKNFGVEFDYGNNAPRGGKGGDYAVISKRTDSLESFVNTLLNEEKRANEEEAVRKSNQHKAILSMTISGEEKQKFIQKTKGLSNKQKRKIAHNFAGRKLGFYSTEGMQKFYDLK